MTPLLAALVDWDAVWKITLVAVCGGIGITAIFGFAVIRLEAFDIARSQQRSGVADLAAAIICGALCVTAVVVGLLAVLSHKS